MRTQRTRCAYSAALRDVARTAICATLINGANQRARTDMPTLMMPCAALMLLPAARARRHARVRVYDVALPALLISH